MNLKLNFTALIFVLFISLSLFPLDSKAQEVFLRYDHPVHEFLERLDARGIIKLNTEVKPISRRVAAKFLSEIENSVIELNPVEKDEFLFLKSEFANELGMSRKGGSLEWNPFNIDSMGVQERTFMYSYSDENFVMRIRPVLGYGERYIAGESNKIRWPGINFYGYASDWLGASFEYVDFGESGNSVDAKKKYSPLTGAFINNQTSNTYEYSDLKGSLTFSWDWGYLSIIKDYQTWGQGRYGQVILSDKAPSFAQVRLHVSPVPWFRFYYYQGWLNSQIKDSSNAYYTHIGSEISEPVIPFRDKYIVSNLASFSVLPVLDISVGNAFVYGPNFRIETLIPIMYYKALDHNTGRIAGDDGNGMLFADYKLKYPVNTVFYASFYVDVINFRDLLNGRTDNQWIAFTLGGKRYDVIFDNLDINIEYTRMNPWVYENRNQLTDYKHLNYQLGHWLGQNADQLRLQFNYSHMRGLKYKLYFERVRKGIEADIARAYKPEKYGVVNFLESPLREDYRYGIDVTYEWIHDLKSRLYFEYSDISDEDASRTPKYLLGKVTSFGFGLSYGL
ncbi:MAG: hypothetical protein HUU54_01280 [Ignavibacteriaceae bacterium]|nr:hypothetical protein [Ignavibacteriaceae bacterium]